MYGGSPRNWFPVPGSMDAAKGRGSPFVLRIAVACGADIR
jgi:hypothetical protein